MNQREEARRLLREAKARAKASQEATEALQELKRMGGRSWRGRVAVGARAPETTGQSPRYSARLVGTHPTATMPSYFGQVPTYRYELPCGHTARYVVAVPVGEYGYCRQCDTYWVHDDTVTEHRPVQGGRHNATDIAIMKTRIASDLLAWPGQGTVEALAAQHGVSSSMVVSIRADLGIERFDTRGEE